MREKLRELCQNNHSLCEYMERIYVRETPQSVFRYLLKKRLRLFLFLLSLLVLALVYSRLQPETPLPLSGNQLVRQREDTEVELQVEGHSAKGDWQQNMTITIGSRQFTSQEKERLTKQAEQHLQQQLLKSNPSLEKVNKDFCLPEGIPDTGIEVSWSVDETYLSERGELIYTALPKEGADTELMAKASWNNWSATFYFPIHLVARKYSDKEAAVRRVKDTLQQTVAEQAEQQTITLPNQIGDMKVHYSMESGGKNYTFVYLVLGVILLLPLVWRQQQKKELAERDEQLLMDHPGLVNKFMLLLGAGLTVRKVVERLTEEYEQERGKGGKKRYVYEEMCVMAQELKDGVSESKALEHFGKRCRLLPYLRFVSVMTQNIKKGAEGILLILEKESLEALEQRKERALQLGEKAGTKLLFPMMLMLGIVMFIIMVPAFMTM